MHQCDVATTQEPDADMMEEDGERSLVLVAADNILLLQLLLLLLLLLWQILLLNVTVTIPVIAAAAVTVTAAVSVSVTDTDAAVTTSAAQFIGYSGEVFLEARLLRCFIFISFYVFPPPSPLSAHD